MSNFKNRNVEYPNRKRVTIQKIEYDNNGEIIELIADLEREEGKVNEEGTALNAESLNEVIQNMIDKEINTLTLTDEEKVKSDLATLSISKEVTNSLTLPLTWRRGCEIIWEVVSGDGITIANNIASVTQKNTVQTATIKATITSGNYSESKTFDITIINREMSDAERVRIDMDDTIVPTNVISSFALPTSGRNGSSITWIAALAVEGPELSGNSVIVERRTSDSGIILVGNFKYGCYSDSKQYNVRVVGTDCFNPKTFSTSITQVKSLPESKSFTITTSSLDNLYIEVDNDNNEDLSVIISNNGSASVTVQVSETTALNTSSGSGSEIIDFKLNVYLDDTLFVGTIPCSISYYYSSETPED